MESHEQLNPIQQFKYDLRALVTNLSALNELSNKMAQEDIAKYRTKLNKLNEIFEDHKTAFSDDELVNFSELLNKAEMQLEELQGGDISNA